LAQQRNVQDPKFKQIRLIDGMDITRCYGLVAEECGSSNVREACQNCCRSTYLTLLVHENHPTNCHHQVHCRFDCLCLLCGTAMLLRLRQKTRMREGNKRISPAVNGCLFLAFL
jgi:hypothetical protein